eukprot:3794277-Prymnesium_polylepis.1
MPAHARTTVHRRAQNRSERRTCLPAAPTRCAGRGEASDTDAPRAAASPSAMGHGVSRSPAARSPRARPPRSRRALAAREVSVSPPGA